MSLRSWPSLLSRVGASAAVLAVLCSPPPVLAQEGPRLLTGLTAEAGPDGVALAGSVDETLERTGGAARLAGRIDNIVLAPLDRETLQPAAGPSLPWRSLILYAAPAREGAWSGAVSAGTRSPPGAPGNMPGANAFRGDWRAAAYGPDAGEVAGRLRLWTPLAAGADPITDWPEQVVLVAGFGAARTQ